MRNVYDYIGDKMVRRKLDPVECLRLYKKGLSDMQIACRCGLAEGTVYEWRRMMGLPQNGSANTDRCRDCRYWKTGDGSYNTGSFCFCHHLLDTGKRRVVGEDGKCKSQKTR